MVHYCTHKSTTGPYSKPVKTQSRHSHPMYNYFNIILQPTPEVPKKFIHLQFSNKNCIYIYFSCPVCTLYAPLIHLGRIILNSGVNRDWWHKIHMCMLTCRFRKYCNARWRDPLNLKYSTNILGSSLYYHHILKQWLFSGANVVKLHFLIQYFVYSTNYLWWMILCLIKITFILLCQSFSIQDK